MTTHPGGDPVTEPVPEWVHMAEVPPTDEEPWAPPDEPGHVTPVGGWILASLMILGVLVAVVWRVMR